MTTLFFTHSFTTFSNLQSDAFKKLRNYLAAAAGAGALIFFATVPSRNPLLCTKKQTRTHLLQFVAL